MRTTLDLPQDLLRKAQSVLHARTKTETIILGLKQVLRRDKISGLIALRGKMNLKIDLKKSRERI
ncbi:MAG: hypothetical protein A3A86_05000 [Elusimicrobia bacterium RIFCSPLOWO2_01_FULL_60_11]|nr:MAG: hypothetical protein A3A86_05000 [Elusimicrobia bacterium RIFCSPLOWO2_01_FULL_60_11]